MNDKPLVSIVTPAFNAADTIVETYNSIKKQTFSNWEWIIIDDCSFDNTKSVILDIKKNDTRVRFLETEKNSGAAIARNIGIKAANGRFIAFIDADDLWKEEKLELQLSFMITNNYSFSYTDYFIFFPTGKRKMYKTKKTYITYKNLLKTNMIGCLTVIYNSSLIGKHYMPVDAPKREDHAAWLDIIKVSKKAYRFGEPLSEYRVGTNSVSSKKIEMIKYQYLLYRRHEGFNIIKSVWYTACVIFHKVFRKYRY